MSRVWSKDGRFYIEASERSSDSYMHSFTSYSWCVGRSESDEVIESFSGAWDQDAGGESKRGVEDVTFSDDGLALVVRSYDAPEERVPLPPATDTELRATQERVRLWEAHMASSDAHTAHVEFGKPTELFGRRVALSALIDSQYGLPGRGVLSGRDVRLVIGDFDVLLPAGPRVATCNGLLLGAEVVAGRAGCRVVAREVGPMVRDAEVVVAEQWQAFVDAHPPGVLLGAKMSNGGRRTHGWRPTGSTWVNSGVPFDAAAWRRGQSSGALRASATSMRTRFFFALAPLVVFAAGCIAEHVVPVAWSVPGIEIDVDGEREVLEQSLCTESTAHSCRVLSALHATEGGATARAPSLPPLLPRAFVLHETRETIDVAAWLDEQRREVHDILPNVSFSLRADDLPEALDGFTIADASIRFDDDQLEVNLPELDILVDGERIGVVSEHVGGSGAAAVVSLVDGGAAALRRSLADGGEVTLVPIDASALSFLLPEGEKLHRPAGTATIGLDLVVEVSTANLVEQMK